MAKMINPTPILDGEDKRKFLQALQVSYDSKKEKFLNECREFASKIKKEI
ncbi:hypothetical protein HYU12_01455 [Candidatus Woesearchaeota archaeon]|nr:hypothetical protein [Candidatus Woesearchaeota archaeon]